MSTPGPGTGHGDRITLTGVSAVGFHGVLEEEQRTGQPFVVDLVLHLDLHPAGTTDDLTRTVHYGQVAERVHETVVGTRFQLVEALAEEIARRLFADFPALAALEVTVHKPEAPIEVPFSDVAVSIVRTRSGQPGGGRR